MQVKGYKQLSPEVVQLANEIKDAEQVLANLYNKVETKVNDEYQDHFNEILNAKGVNGLIEEDNKNMLDQLLQRPHQIQKAKDALKESSMWAVRAVFQPEESY